MDSNEFGNGKMALVSYDINWFAKMPNELNYRIFDVTIEFLSKYRDQLRRHLVGY